MITRPNSDKKAAIYARVSSDAQAQEQTIDSQVVALRQQVAQDGLPLSDDNCFLDELAGLAKRMFCTFVGGAITPLLANLFLHYVLDLWVNQWRTRCATGDVIIVRYADDFALGFQHCHEAERFLQELRERLEKFRLRLHPDKTRLIEFGRFATENRQRRGAGKPETFDFLSPTPVERSSRRRAFSYGG